LRDAGEGERERDEPAVGREVAREDLHAGKLERHADSSMILCPALSSAATARESTSWCTNT
jgi:hypothetical protein